MLPFSQFQLPLSTDVSTTGLVLTSTGSLLQYWQPITVLAAYYESAIVNGGSCDVGQELPAILDATGFRVEAASQDATAFFFTPPMIGIVAFREEEG